MTSYLCYEPSMELLRLSATYRWNPRRCLAYPRRNLLCSHLHFAVSLGYPRMEPTEEMDYPGWNLLKSRTTSDGVRSWVTYMLLLPSCYPQRKPTVEMNCPGWNPLQPSTCCSFHWTTSIWRLWRRWASLDGITAETKNCCLGWNRHLQKILS